MVKIRTQIAALRNSKLLNTQKRDIEERAQEKYGNFKESMRPTKTTNVDESGTAPATINVVPAEPPMFLAVNLPATRKNKCKRFLMFVSENPDLIAKNEQN